MKTKKLIELLQKEDPSGEEEVCIGNQDILCVETKPAYWDGCLQVLERDWTSEYYNVIGARYESDGIKLNLVPHGIEDAIFENIDLPVNFDSEYTEKFKDQVAHYREEARNIKKQFEQQSFFEVLKKYKEGWKAAQSKQEPLTRCNVQWWWKEGDKRTKRSFYGEKDYDIEMALCNGHSRVVVKSGFFAPVDDGERIIWNLNI